MEPRKATEQSQFDRVTVLTVTVSCVRRLFYKSDDTLTYINHSVRQMSTKGYPMGPQEEYVNQFFTPPLYLVNPTTGKRLLKIGVENIRYNKWSCNKTSFDNFAI